MSNRMSKSYCIWGYCDNTLTPALVDAVSKFCLEILKFALLLVATFYLAIGIFHWWDYAAPPVCTNFDLHSSSVSLKATGCKKSAKTFKKSEFETFTVEPVVSHTSTADFITCKCGRKLQIEDKNRNYFPTTNNNEVSNQNQQQSIHLLKTVQQMMPSSHTIQTILSEIKSAELRRGPTQNSSATQTNSPCDGPNIAKIYSELIKHNAMQMYLNEMRQFGLAESLLEKIKRSNVTTASLNENPTYPANNSQLATGPVVIDCAKPDTAVQYIRNGSFRSSSNEVNIQLPTQFLPLDRNLNPSESTVPVQPTLPSSVSKEIPLSTNINVVPKERVSDARVCRCRNPKCKRRVQLY